MFLIDAGLLTHAQHIFMHVKFVSGLFKKKKFVLISLFGYAFGNGNSFFRLEIF